MADQQPTVEEPTIGKLVVDASRDISSLVQQEIKLAKSELKVSVQAGGMGIGLFAAAGFIVLLAIIMLSCAFAYFLTMAGLHPAWSFLIVFGVYMLIAAVLAFIGIKSVKRVRAPQRSIAQAQDTVATLKRK